MILSIRVPPSKARYLAIKKSRHLSIKVTDKKGLFRCESLVQNQSMIFGYARVSTDGQSVDAQVKQLRAAGAEKIFKETASGAKTERAELARALRRLDDGDTLLVTRLDRLARSTRDLLNTLAQIADKGAGFRSPINL
jgi:predicted site-specific integrase-resolvase